MQKLNVLKQRMHVCGFQPIERETAMAGAGMACQLCAQKGLQNFLRLYQFSFDEAVYMCPNMECTYPMGLDELPLFTKRPYSEIPVRKKRRGPRTQSQSTSCSSSRTGSPPPLVHGQQLKPPTKVASTKPEAFVASVTQKLAASMPGGNGINRLPKFDSLVLAGNQQAMKRVRPSSTTSPSHSPCRKLQKTEQSYLPNFAPPNLVGPAKITPNLEENLVAIKDSIMDNNVLVKTPSAFENTPVRVNDCNGGEIVRDVPEASAFTKNCDAQPYGLPFLSLGDTFMSPPKPERVKMDNFVPSNCEMKAESKLIPELAATNELQEVPYIQNGSSQSLKQTNKTEVKNGLNANKPKTTKSKAPTLLASVKALSHIQWSNKDALCWLDVTMNLLVHSRSFHNLVKSRPKSACPVVKQLLEKYTKAQSLFKQALEFKRYQLIGQKRTVVLETSVGMVSVKTGGGDGTDVLPGSNTPETLVVKTSLSPLIPSKRPQNHLTGNETAPKMEVTTQELLTRSNQLSEASRELLVNCRESVWSFLQPKLKCQKGENDSPVFALPLLLAEDPEIKRQLMNNFEWQMTCSVCGHQHRDKVSKVLLTFPAIPADFSMKAPYFLRACFHCKAPEQRLSMQRSGIYPPIILAHFVEGVHKGAPRYDFFHRGRLYEVTALVQYCHHPDHFVAWIRHPQLNLWMEVNDLKHEVVRYTSTPPSFPPSQIHMIMWTQKPTRTSPTEPPLLYMSPLKTPLPQKREPVARKKPTPKIAVEQCLSSPVPLRSSLRSPQKTPQGPEINMNFSNGVVREMVYRGSPSQNGTTPRSGLGKLRKKYDAMDVQDFAKELREHVRNGRLFSRAQQDRGAGKQKQQQQQQFEGYIPRALLKEKKEEVKNTRLSKPNQPENSKSVCFKSRTPTPESFASDKAHKKKAFLQRFHKHLKNIDDRQLSLGVDFSKRPKTSNAQIAVDLSNHVNTVNANGVRNSNRTPKMGGNIERVAKSHESFSIDDILGNSVSSDYSMTSSNDLADFSDAVLGSLGQDFNTPQSEASQTDTGSVLADFDNLLNSNAASPFSVPDTATAMEDFDLDMFIT